MNDTKLSDDYECLAGGERRLHVCHIVENLDHGAVENWLVRSFSTARERYPHLIWTFYCILPQAGRLEERVKQLGGRVVHSPYLISDTWAFERSLRKYLRETLPDVLHCHHDFLSALYLLAAVGLPIKRRYVHVHNTDESLPVSSWKQRLLLEPFRQVCMNLADGIIGISNHTLDQFLRHKPRRPGRDQVVYYGVNLEPVQAAAIQRSDFRRQFNIPFDAKVLVFIGRLAHLKNPVFVVDVLKSLLTLEPNAYAIFAGSGDLAHDVEQRASELGIADRIRLLGWRDDAAYLMKNSDLFIFPRLETPREGLGLVVVESQACGLPMLTTSGIPTDAIVNEQLVKFLPLNATHQQWAQVAVQELNKPRQAFEVAANRIEQSQFNMQHSVNCLIELHTSEATL